MVSHITTGEIKFVMDTTFLGLLGVTVLSSLWMFFAPLNWVWSITLIGIAIVSYLSNLGTVKNHFQDGKVLLKSMVLRQKILILFVVTIVVFCSSLPAFMLDNESYYVQTVKWLDQYGLVKGVANLHMYLGQQSGLHILEAALNFDELYDRWNDVSSFYLLLGLFWSIKQVKTENALQHNYRRFFVVLVLISLPFISASSPDVPVFVLSYIIIYKFLKVWEFWDEYQFLIMTLLIMQLIFFKVSAALIFILPIVLQVKYYKTKISTNWIYFGVVFTSLFILKNIIATGLPLYPLTSWSPLEWSWTLPIELMDIVPNQAYLLNNESLSQLTTVEIFNHWFFMPGFDGLLNKLIIIGVVVSLLFIIFKNGFIHIKVVVAILLLHSFLLALTSPQFRFFINLLVPAMVLIVISFWNPKEKFMRFVTYTFLLSGLVIATYSSLDNLANYNYKVKDSDYSLDFSILIEPASKSIYSSKFKQIEKSGFPYSVPLENSFFFGMYDIPLPATSKRYVDYIENKFDLIPQQMGPSINDGFEYVRNKK